MIQSFAKNSKPGRIHRLLAVILSSLFLFSSIPAGAAPLSDQPWTSNGSTGTVDETSYDLITYLNGSVYLSNNGGPYSEATIRYNITFTPGLTQLNTTIFKARILDNGPQARVILYLKSYEFETGIVRTLNTIDSDQYLPSNNFYLVKVNGLPNFLGEGGWSVREFKKYSYYIEAHLIRTGWGGNPALGNLMVDSEAIFN